MVAIECLERVSGCVARRRACPPSPKMYPSRTRTASNLATTGNTLCLFTGLLCKPSDGLEPSTPSLPCALGVSQRVAVHTEWLQTRAFLVRRVAAIRADSPRRVSTQFPAKAAERQTKSGHPWAALGASRTQAAVGLWRGNAQKQQRLTHRSYVYVQRAWTRSDDRWAACRVRDAWRMMVA